MKVKEQEWDAKSKKLIIERDDAQRALANTRKRLDEELNAKQKLQIQVNNL